MRSNQALIAFLLCLLAGLASAQTTTKALDINVNTEAVRLSFTWQPGDPSYLADVGWLYNQDRGDVIHASFHLVGDANGPGSPLQAGLGVRLVYTRTDPSTFDGGALALGGFARYTLPNADRFSIGAYGYYAPDVTSFGDQREYYEVGARVGYSVIRDGDAYLGLRRVQAKYDGSGEFLFDSDLHVGFEFRFR